MNLSNARATFGLQAKATPTSSNVSGSVQIGANTETISLTGGNVAYSLRAIFAGAGNELVIDYDTNDTSLSTAFVAGAAQVETATAAGTISGSGNATVTVTAAGMPGSPKAISVSVLAADTAAVWAGKVRTALAADAAVSALFNVSGATTAIILTRKPTSTYNVPDGILNLYAANDATLNIALDNGTCTGITTAATSANTTAGVASDGTKVYDGDEKDFEGVALPTIPVFRAALFKCASGEAAYTSSTEYFTIAAGTSIAFGSSESTESVIDGSGAFTASEATDITITIIGQTA